MTRVAYRIVQRGLVRRAMDGEGARRFGGRWNSPGRSVVYTAESRSLAAMELLVHLVSSRRLREGYRLIPVQFDQALVLRVEDRFGLPRDWQRYPAPGSTRTIGDAWLIKQMSCVLSVPSAVMTSERNFLLNPLHPDFRQLKIGKPERFAYDPRLTG